MKTIIGDSIETPTTYTRPEIGQKLIPPVSAKTVQKYLKIAKLFVPGFEHFRKCPNAPLEEIHIPVLQKIREYVIKTNSLIQARVMIAEEYGRQSNS